MRTSIWLVRHGQTEANRQRRYQSSSDSPLTTYGERQMRLLAQRLRPLPFSQIIHSPTQRTRVLAELVTADHPKALRREDPLWGETRHGRWEGLTYREVLARYPDEARARWNQGINGKPLHGESLAEVHTRVVTAFQGLLRNASGGRLLVVTHATPIQLVLCAAFNLPPSEHWHWRIDLGSVTCLDVYPSGAIVRMINEVPRQTHDEATDE